MAENFFRIFKILIFQVSIFQNRLCLRRIHIIQSQNLSISLVKLLGKNRKLKIPSHFISDSFSICRRFKRQYLLLWYHNPPFLFYFSFLFFSNFLISPCYFPFCLFFSLFISHSLNPFQFSRSPTFAYAHFKFKGQNWKAENSSKFEERKNNEEILWIQGDKGDKRFFLLLSRFIFEISRSTFPFIIRKFSIILPLITFVKHSLILLIFIV